MCPNTCGDLKSMLGVILGLPPSPQAFHVLACLLASHACTVNAVSTEPSPGPPPSSSTRFVFTIIRETFCFITSQRCSFIVSYRILIPFLHLYSFPNGNPCYMLQLIFSSLIRDINFLISSVHLTHPLPLLW